MIFSALCLRSVQGMWSAERLVLLRLLIVFARERVLVTCAQKLAVAGEFVLTADLRA